MSRKLELLMVEDVELDAELVAAELRHLGYHFALERVDTAETLRAALAASRRDLVLCDHSMPSFESREALAIVQAADDEVPVVILSGTIGEEATVDALRQGVRGVVLKSNIARLGPVIDRELAEAESRRLRRQAEDEIVRLAAIVESCNDAIVGMTLDGKISSWNAAAERIYGRPAAAVLGTPFASILPADLRRELQRIDAHLKRGDAVERVEAELAPHASGDRVEVELSLSPVRDADGTIVGSSAIARDVSERRRADRERKRLEDQLHQSQKLEAVAALAGGIAHDFNNLLTVVTGYSEHLLGVVHEPEQLQAGLEQIRLAADRGSALTRRLLAFSRQQNLEQRVVDLNAIVRGIEPMLRRLIREDVQIVTQLDPRAGSVTADPSQLEHVILNLVLNARDAIPAGGTISIVTRDAELDRAFLECRGAASSEPGSYVELSVRDTGVGIDAETQARVFEPFFTTKEVGKGTGLGLASVHGIVTQSRGIIHLRSAVDRGSTFTVYLPVVHAPLEATPAPRHAAGQGPRTETVLVAEDDRGIRHLLRHILTASGHEVLAAADGAEALELSERHDGPIDLVITDIVMPRLGGPELARQLRARRPATKLLYMSGYNEVVVADALHDDGADFIHKPFSAAGLLDKVAGLLDPGARASLVPGDPSEARVSRSS